MNLASIKLPILLSLTAHGVVLGGVGFGLGFIGNSEINNPQSTQYFTVSIEQGVPEGSKNSKEIEQPVNLEPVIEEAPVVSLNRVKKVSNVEPKKSKSAPKQKENTERKGSVLPALGVQDGASGNTSGNGIGVSFLTASMKFAPKPPYPPVARKVGAEGTVVLNALIDQLGSVKKVSMITSSGRHDLDDAAQSTVASKWRFNPAKKEGIPVESEEQVVVVFRLEG